MSGKNFSAPTSEQIENTRVAYAIMAGIPARKILLGSYRQRPETVGCSDDQLINECGTSGCIGGWLAAHPYFRERGLTFNRYSLRYRKLNSSMSASHALFGNGFIFISGASGIEGKRQALERLRRHLRDNGAITARRDEQLQRQEERMTA